MDLGSSIVVMVTLSDILSSLPSLTTRVMVYIPTLSAVNVGASAVVLDRVAVLSFGLVVILHR